jgi:hypothetical protein
MPQVQTNELPQHLDPLLTVEDVAARRNFSRSSTALPNPTRKTATILTRLAPHGISKIPNIELVNWVQGHIADDRHLHPSVFEGSHDA